MTFLLSMIFFRVDSAVANKKGRGRSAKAMHCRPNRLQKHLNHQFYVSFIKILVMKSYQSVIIITASFLTNVYGLPIQTFDRWPQSSRNFRLPIDKFQLKLFNHELFIIPLKILRYNLVSSRVRDQMMPCKCSRTKQKKWATRNVYKMWREKIIDSRDEMN